MQHATTAYRGVRVYYQAEILSMDNKNGQHHSPIAVLPRQKATGTHRDRGWMGPRTGLGAFEKKKNLLLTFLLTYSMEQNPS